MNTAVNNVSTWCMKFCRGDIYDILLNLYTITICPSALICWHQFFIHFGIWICFFYPWIIHEYFMGTFVIWETNELSMNNSLLFIARADKILNHELLMNSSWIVHGSENRFYTMNSSWFTHEQFMVMNFRKTIF